jgi:biotin--protein ligase
MTTHPSVLFLYSRRPGAVTRVLEALSGSHDTHKAFEVKADNDVDTFSFHPSKDAGTVLKLTPSDVKHVIAYADEELPAADLTTLFNLQQYFHYLAEARKHTKENDDGGWGFGEVILYGEIVTSTQTMFDK